MSRQRPGFETTCPRIHNKRARSIPTAAAEPASKTSSASTRATSSPRAVAAASICRRRLVRPEERAPTSSDNCPRGNPPPNRASKVVTPVGARSYSTLFLFGLFLFGLFLLGLFLLGF